MFIRRIFLIASALAFVACADVTPGEDASLPPGCDFNGWEPQGRAYAVGEKLDGVLDYTALFSNSSEGETDDDMMSIELYYSYGAEAGPQTVQLTGATIQRCAYCLMINKECSDVTGRCEGLYLAQSGTLEITSNSGLSGQFTGTLTNAKFAEVTVSEVTGESTLVPNGRIFCVDSYAFDQEIQEANE